MKQFKKINGFANAFWGWGGEDDDLWNRYVACRKWREWFACKFQLTGLRDLVSNFTRHVNKKNCNIKLKRNDFCQFFQKICILGCILHYILILAIPTAWKSSLFSLYAIQPYFDSYHSYKITYRQCPSPQPCHH